jgi:hypothetical protein
MRRADWLACLWLLPFIAIIDLSVWGLPWK